MISWVPAVIFTTIFGPISSVTSTAWAGSEDAPKSPWSLPERPTCRSQAMAAKRSRRKWGKGNVGAIYARYSTKDQDSIESQVSRCREWADANGIQVPERLVFADEGTTGKKCRRPGLTRFEQALRSDEADVAIVLTSSRLYRKMRRALQFVDEMLGAGKRCVFVGQDIDYDSAQDSQLNFKIQAMVDELQASAQTPNIHAAHLQNFHEGIVFGTLSFGYAGEPIHNRTSKKGKPVKRIVTEPIEAKWVRQIFQWFVDDGLSVPEIVRRLNAASAVLPPRVRSRRWTVLAVRNALANARYRGYWVYGETENVWQDEGDYARQFLRDAPLATRQAEDLRIVDDAIWYAAQDRIANDPYRGSGRRSNKPKHEQQPKVLNGILHCGECDQRRRLTTGGARGSKYICQECGATDRSLFTHLCRARAHSVVFAKIRELITADDGIVSGIIMLCRKAAEKMQKPDPMVVAQLDAKLKKLQGHERFILRHPGEDERGQAESDRALKETRAEIAESRAALAAIKERTGDEVRIPSEAEARERLDALDTILADAINTPDGAAGARKIVEAITGGRIYVYQRGERMPGKGWLVGQFRVNLVAALAGEFGAVCSEADADLIEVSFREPPIHEQIADRVKELYDRGNMFREIAVEVGRNRNLVRKALDWWHTSRGITPPDPKREMVRLNRQRMAERIADRVMELVGEDKPLKDIGEIIGVSRKAITKAIRFWHERRGLPAPDGRVLRKARNARRRLGK